MGQKRPRQPRSSAAGNVPTNRVHLFLIFSRYSYRDIQDSTSGFAVWNHVCPWLRIRLLVTAEIDWPAKKFGLACVHNATGQSEWRGGDTTAYMIGYQIFVPNRAYSPTFPARRKEAITDWVDWGCSRQKCQTHISVFEPLLLATSFQPPLSKLDAFEASRTLTVLVTSRLAARHDLEYRS